MKEKPGMISYKTARLIMMIVCALYTIGLYGQIRHFLGENPTLPLSLLIIMLITEYIIIAKIYKKPS